MQLPFSESRLVKITVVIPAFNAEDTIIPTLNSVFTQTYKPLDVIIVDDNSTDETYNIVSDYIQSNNLSNWKLLSQPNSGPASARDNGIRSATGDYIALLDSDDMWLPDKLEATLAHLIRLKLDIIGAHLTANGSNNSCHLISPKKMLFVNPYFTSTVIFSRKTYVEVGGFDTKQRYSEDYKLWLSFAWHGKRCGQMSESHAVYHSIASRPHKGLSTHLWQMQFNELANFRWLYLKNLIPISWCVIAQIISLMKFFRRVIWS